MKLRIIGTLFFASAQLPLAADTAPPKTVDLNQTIDREIQQKKGDLAATIAYGATVVDTLSQGFFVSDENLDHLARNLISLERRGARGVGDHTVPYLASRQLIGELIPHLAPRPIAEAKLHGHLATIFERMGDAKAQLSEQEKALQLATAQHYAVDILVITTRMKQAEALAKAGREQEADSAYLDVFEYPWWRVKDLYERQAFTFNYGLAARRLIELRKGHAQALKEIRLIPRATDLQPVLEKAIRDAETRDVRAGLEAHIENQKAAAEGEKAGG
ncbi:hypothetical protein EON80_12695 [bacterium]|nr:MAG: hypothetical protein EON80_12695 [bacterium]